MSDQQITYSRLVTGVRLVGMVLAATIVAGCASTPTVPQQLPTQQTRTRAESDFIRDVADAFKQNAEVFTPAAASCAAEKLVDAFGIIEAPVMVSDAEVLSNLRAVKLWHWSSAEGFAAGRAYRIVVTCGANLQSLTVDDNVNTAVLGDVTCARRLATKEAMRAHYTIAWSEPAEFREEPTRLEKRLVAQCHGFDRWRESKVWAKDDHPMSPEPEPGEEEAESFCRDQLELIQEMWVNGELTEREYDLQVQEIDDVCVGF